MRTMLNSIPEPLVRRIFTRITLTLALLIATIILLTVSSDFRPVIPGIGLTIFFFVDTGLLFCRAATGEYIVLSGICCAADHTLFRKHAKSVTLDTHEGLVKVFLKDRRLKIPLGQPVDVYVAANTPVYQIGTLNTLNAYLVLTTGAAAQQRKNDME